MKAVVELGASPRAFGTHHGVAPHSLVPGLIVEDQESAAARLFKLDQLEVSWEQPAGTLWTFMRPHGRPCFNLDLLEDFHAWQRGILAAFGGLGQTLRYLVLSSRTTGAFNLGGDLNYFLGRISQQDKAALLAYGVSCIQILYRNIERLSLPIVTIGVAQGDALGGGLESLLSFNVIIAERQARFGFPESHFGLFPGMGAYSLVSRRVGSVIAEDMILSGRIYTAEEMKEIGLIHILAEPGEGLATARNYIRENARRHAGLQAFFQAAREVNSVTYDELERVVEIWADTCLRLKQRELKVMQRLVSAQDRLYCAP